MAQMAQEFSWNTEEIVSLFMDADSTYNCEHCNLTVLKKVTIVLYTLQSQR